MYLAEYLIEIKEISCLFNLAILLLRSGLLSPLNTFISWFEIGFVILSLCLSHTVLVENSILTTWLVVERLQRISN